MYYIYMFLCKAGNKFSSEVLQLNHKSGVENYIKDISKYRLLKCDTLLIPSFPCWASLTVQLGELEKAPLK